MYKIELNQTICRIIKILYQFGIWHGEEVSAFRKTGWKLFYSLFFMLYLIFFVTCAVVSDEKNESIFLAEISIFLAVVLLKLVYLLWSKNEILGFLNAHIVTHSIGDREEWKHVNTKIENFMKFCRIYVSMIVCADIYMVVSCLPIFTSEKKLPLLISFSLDWQCSEIIYWILFIFDCGGAFCANLFNLTTVLIWYVMLICSIEYQVLGNKLKNLGTNGNMKRQLHKISKSARPDAFSQDMIGLIKAHQEIFDTIERFTLCFSKLFFIQMATSGISTAVSIYNLAYSSPENVFQTFTFIAAAIYAICDIFLVMYLANEITLTSDRLPYCMFESNWIEQSDSCKEILIIFCEVLKQPQQLVILIYQMNLGSFTSIINRAYSMFNILKTLSD